jgi:hypothetical protein
MNRIPPLLVRIRSFIRSSKEKPAAAGAGRALAIAARRAIVSS